MLRLFSLLPFFFVLVACASTGKDVIKCGKGTYVVSGSPDHPFGNYIKTSQNVAFSRANAFCSSKRKHVLVENIEEGLPTHVTFRCVAEDDPALKQSDYPNITALTNKNPCDGNRK